MQILWEEDMRLNYAYLVLFPSMTCDRPIKLHGKGERDGAWCSAENQLQPTLCYI